MASWLLTRRNALRLASTVVPAAGLTFATASASAVSASTPGGLAAVTNATGSISNTTSDGGFSVVVLVHDGTSYPTRPSTAITPAGWATYKGPTQPTDWLPNDDWENNT